MAESEPAPFTDVSSGSWYYEQVCKAAALGITSGIGEGKFAPDVSIFRQEMFTMTYNALVKFWLLTPGEEKSQ